MKVRWTKEQDQVVIDFYATEGSVGCIVRLAALGRVATHNAVGAKASSMGIKALTYTWKGRVIQHGSHGSALKQPPRRVTGPAGNKDKADESRAKYTFAPTPPPRFSADPSYVGALMNEWNRLRSSP